MLAPATALPADATLDAWRETLAPFARVRFVGDGAVRYRDIIRGRLGAQAAIDGTSPMLAAACGRIAAARTGSRRPPARSRAALHPPSRRRARSRSPGRSRRAIVPGLMRVERLLDGTAAADDDIDAIVGLEAESFTNPWSRETLMWELQNSDVTRIYVLRDEAGAVPGVLPLLGHLRRAPHQHAGGEAGGPPGRPGDGPDAGRDG